MNDQKISLALFPELARWVQQATTFAEKFQAVLTENAALKKENADLKRQNETMAGHPDVIAAQAKAARARADALTAQAKTAEDEAGRLAKATSLVPPK